MNPRHLVASIALTVVLVASAVPAFADQIVPGAVAAAGSATTLSAGITNTESQQHSYKLSATGLPSGTSAVFTEGAQAVTDVTVQANGSAAVVLRVDVPATTEARTYSADIVAKRDDGTTLDMPFTLTVDNARALEIVSTSKNVTTFSGQEFTLDVTAKNTGTQAVTGLTPSMEMPPKWVLVSEPASVASLAPGEETTFHLRVTVPSSQVAIGQPVKVTVVAREAASPAADLAVRVQSNPVFLPVAVGLVLLALVGVVVYFKRKGRR